MTGCSCEVCKAMCKCPCWPLPEEAEKLIKAGYADRMMRDYWVRDHDEIDVICPAMRGYEAAADTPCFRDHGCVFQRSDGLCELHDLGLKPFEGREARHEPKGGWSAKEDRKINNRRRDIARTWDTSRGRAVVDKWKTLVEFGEKKGKE